jgi:hypothetical protein
VTIIVVAAAIIFAAWGYSTARDKASTPMPS